MVISFVIVEYFCLDNLERAVQSIFEYTQAAIFEIIIVSNSVYAPEKQDEIRSSFPGISVIFSRKNVGFGKAVNEGIRKSSGEFILLLNPDGMLIDHSLQVAIDFMSAHPQIAAIGPKIVENTGEIQDSCREFMTFGILVTRMMKRLILKKSGPVLENKDYLSRHQVDWVSGACMLVRKDAITSTGMLDERYFMYVEDMDWCRNFHVKGWQVWYLPDWIVQHNAGRASTGRACLVNRLMWIHFASFCKYSLKWALNRDGKKW